MINFRFHLVSLVAVFLALALGVVMGSTVIDRAIVDGLQARINNVEKRADARRKENLELEKRLEALEAYADEAVPHLLGRRLERVPVTVVAVRGVDGGAVRSTAETLQTAGAVVPGVVWIEPSFALADAEAQAKLSQAVGDPFHQGDDLRQTVIEGLGRRLAFGPQPLPGAAPTLFGSDDLLVALGAAGFVAFEALGGTEVDLARYPQPGSRLLVIDGSQGRVETAAAALPLVRSVASAGALVALGEVFRRSDSGRARGTVVQGVRDDQGLASRVATVDDLDESRGRTALALAVEELGQGRAGHYGQGPGATRQLPEVEAPLSPSVPSPGT